jgi:hypothetical protein
MKINQKIKSVFYALCFTVALMFSFKSSSAQTIYARLEKQDYYSYSGPDGTNPTYPSRLYISYEVYVRFYTSSACTTRVTLDENVTAGLGVTEYYDEALNYGGFYVLDNNITPGLGESEVYLGTFIQQDLYYDVYNTGWGLQCVEEGFSVTGNSNLHTYCTIR